MSARRHLPALLAIALLAGCSPSVSVNNATPFEVRAIVSGEGGTHNVLLVRSGQVATGDVPEGGYSVTVVPEQAWSDSARAARDAVALEMADPDQLGPDGVAAVLRELDGLATRVGELEAATGGASRCEGSVAPDGAAIADVTIADDGSLVVSCSGPPVRR